MRPDPIPCAERDRTLLLHAGELESADRAAAAEHARACHACQRTVGDLEAVRTAYRAVPVAPLGAMEMAALLPDGGGLVAPAAHGHGRRLLAAAALAAVCFVGGLATGMQLGTSSRGEHAVASDAPAASGLRAAAAADRLAAVVASTGADAGPALVTELVGLLAQEPNPNVRLAMLDALSGAPLAPADATRLLAVLASEPAPTLRVEIVRLLAGGRPAGLDSVLTRVAASDEAPAVRAAALRALGSL